MEPKCPPEDGTPIQGYGRGTRTVRVLAFAALVVACVLVRVAALDCDPPSWLSWSSGIATDEGFYTLDARHMALFGTWAPGNFHDRLLSPLLSVLQQGVFRLAGPGLVAARGVSVAFGLLSLAVFWLGLRKAFGVRVAVFGLLFLGLAPPVVLYNRMALQETPGVFWLVLAFCLAAYGWTGEEDKDTGGTPVPPASVRRWLFGAGACAAVAVTIKAIAVIALPGFVIGAWAADARMRKASVGALLAGMAAVFAVYAAIWYVPHHAELARMAAYYSGHQYRPHSLGSLWLNVRRGIVGDRGGVLRGAVPYLVAMVPVPAILALTSMRRGERGEPALVVLMIWLACGMAFCLVSSYAPSRYYVLFLPALAGIAAYRLALMPRRIQAVAAGLFMVVSSGWIGKAFVERTRNMTQAQAALVSALPRGGVIVGDFAPVLCLDTPFAAAPVQPDLSNDDHPVERLQATHVAVTRAPVWGKWWRGHYPELVRPENRVVTMMVGARREYVVDVYAVR